MRVLSTTLFSLLFVSTAAAADKELLLDTSSTAINTASWEMVNGSPLTTVGLSGGLEVGSNLTAVIGVNWGQTGSSHGYGYWYEEEAETPGPGSEGFVAALSVVQVQAGLRTDRLDATNWIRPYAVSRLSGTLGIMQLDDDASDSSNVNQITRTGTSFGGMAALGIAVERPRSSAGPFAINGELEGGYALATALKFDELGNLAMHGVHIRAGVGLRF